MENKIYIHIHIPKTAGLFIRKLHETSKGSKLFYPFLSTPRGKSSYTFEHHYNISYLKKHLSSIFSPKVGLFAIVRNPYDRIYSLWKYCRQEGKIASLEIPYVSEKFEDFVCDLCDDEYLGHYFMQSQMFYLKGMNDLNVEIFKFEEMDKIQNFLVNQCNLVWSDKKINDIPGIDYREVYTSDLLDLVKNKFREEFEVFNYPTELN